jgi:hypothetical protein
MNKRNQHVVKTGEGWGLRGENSKKLTKEFNTQAEAIAKGKQVAKNQKVELFVHGRDNKIRARDSYGSDPYPPKG